MHVSFPLVVPLPPNGTTTGTAEKKIPTFLHSVPLGGIAAQHEEILRLRKFTLVFRVGKETKQLP
jgi:hypothetical protein